MPISSVLRKPILRRRLFFGAETALVLATLVIAGPRLAAVRVAQPIGAAVLLVLLFWFCTFVVELGLYFALSWDDFRDLLLISLRSSAPAMWFAPAILFLSTPTYSAGAVGLLLVANTTRLLFSRRVPQNSAPVPQTPERKRPRLFRSFATSPAVPFSRAILPPVLGALALQTGLFTYFSGYPLFAAVLTCCGVSIWTWESVARGAMRRQEETRPSHWLLGIALILFLTTSLSVAEIQVEMAMDSAGASQAQLVETIQRMVRQLEHTPDAPKAPKKKVAGMAVPRRVALEKQSRPMKEMGSDANYFAPGVIVPAEVKAQTRIVLIPNHARGRVPAVKLAGTLTFPFTGEYQIFPTSSARLRHDWAREGGTLLESLYETAGGGSLETEAYQLLAPPLDLTNCGKIRVVLDHDENGPFGASLQLIAGGGRLDLGSDICGLERHGHEVLEYALPAVPGSLLVDAIRVGFHRIPRQGTLSMKVAVREFSLTPR